jgi:hypothetical protein
MAFLAEASAGEVSEGSPLAAASSMGADMASALSIRVTGQGLMK